MAVVAVVVTVGKPTTAGQQVNQVALAVEPVRPEQTLVQRVLINQVIQVSDLETRVDL
jgi:hypothetical protein